MKHLLILSCAKAKRHAPGQMPAIDRYDGPAYRTLRKRFEQETAAGLVPALYGVPFGVELLILSARYGLIDAGTMIEDYDQVLDSQRALQLLPTVRAALAARTAGLAAGDRMLIHPTHLYSRLLPPAWLFDLRRRGVVVDSLGGAPWESAAQLKRWLDSTAAARLGEVM